MFKGINPEFKKQLEKFNEETDFFAFNCFDLETGDCDKDSNKLYLYSEELRQKLGKIIQEKKQPGENIPLPRLIFFHRPARYVRFDMWNFLLRTDWWFVFPKDSLYQMAKRGVEQGKRGFLVYDGEGEDCCISVLPFCNQEEKLKEQKLQEEFRNRTSKLLVSVLNEIDQAIIETKVDISSLEIRYPEILPDHCQCEVEVNLDGSLKDSYLYQHHINNCLGRDEQELNEFKEVILEQIRQSKISFNNYRNSIIQEIKTFCSEKGVEEDSFWFENWEEWLGSATSHQYLQIDKNFLFEAIGNKAKINADQLRWQEEVTRAAEEIERERLRQQAQTQSWTAQEELRRQNQAEADRLNREQAEKQRAGTEKRTQWEQTEKLKREQGKRNLQHWEERLKKQREEKEHQKLDPSLTLTETQEEVQKVLSQILTTNQLQNTDLPEEFHQWSEKLKQLQTKEEVLLYQDFIMSSISRIVEAKKTTQAQPTSTSWVNNLILLGGIFFAALLLLFLLKKLKKK